MRIIVVNGIWEVYVVRESTTPEDRGTDGSDIR